MLPIFFGVMALLLCAPAAFACDGQTGKVVFTNNNGITVTSSPTTQAQEITQSPVMVTLNQGFTGIPGGTFNTAAITATTISKNGDQIYPWGIIGIVKNFTDVLTTGNPNAVAVNGTVFTQTVVGSQPSSSWGGNFVCDERNATAVANPTHFCLGAELDVFEPTGSGTDSNSKRIGLLIGIGPSSADLTTHSFAGIDITPADGTLDNGITFSPQLSTGNITSLINAGLLPAHYTNLLTGNGINIDNKGNIVTSGTVQTTSTTVGALPACTAGLYGTRSFVIDNSTPIAYRAIVAGGGSIGVPVICASGAWIMD